MSIGGGSSSLSTTSSSSMTFSAGSNVLSSSHSEIKSCPSSTESYRKRKWTIGETLALHRWADASNTGPSRQVDWSAYNPSKHGGRSRSN